MAVSSWPSAVRQSTDERSARLIFERRQNSLPQGFASKVGRQRGMRSVPPRSNGWVGDRHASSRGFRRRPVEPTRYRVVVLTSCHVDDRVLRQSSPATISNLGSVAKQFTAMTIMMLSEEKRINYDDAVSKYIPELRGPLIE